MDMVTKVCVEDDLNWLCVLLYCGVVLEYVRASMKPLHK